MTPVEIMALVVVLLGGIKIAVLFADPKKWASVAKKVYGTPLVTQFFAAVFGIGSLYFLLQEVTIVQIFAVMFFFMCLMMMGVAAFGKELVKLVDVILKRKDLVRSTGLLYLIWIVLMVWVIAELFL